MATEVSRSREYIATTAVTERGTAAGDETNDDIAKPTADNHGSSARVNDKAEEDDDDDDSEAEHAGHAAELGQLELAALSRTPGKPFGLRYASPDTERAFVMFSHRHAAGRYVRALLFLLNGLPFLGVSVGKEDTEVQSHYTRFARALYLLVVAVAIAHAVAGSGWVLKRAPCLYQAVGFSSVRRAWVAEYVSVPLAATAVIAGALAFGWHTQMCEPSNHASLSPVARTAVSYAIIAGTLLCDAPRLVTALPMLLLYLAARAVIAVVWATEEGPFDAHAALALQVVLLEVLAAVALCGACDHVRRRHFHCNVSAAWDSACVACIVGSVAHIVGAAGVVDPSVAKAVVLHTPPPSVGHRWRTHGLPHADPITTDLSAEGREKPSTATGAHSPTVHSADLGASGRSDRTSAIMAAKADKDGANVAPGPLQGHSTWWACLTVVALRVERRDTSDDALTILDTARRWVRLRGALHTMATSTLEKLQHPRSDFEGRPAKPTDVEVVFFAAGGDTFFAAFVGPQDAPDGNARASATGAICSPQAIEAALMACRFADAMHNALTAAAIEPRAHRGGDTDPFRDVSGMSAAIATGPGDATVISEDAKIGWSAVCVSGPAVNAALGLLATQGTSRTAQLCPATAYALRKQPDVVAALAGRTHAAGANAMPSRMLLLGHGISPTARAQMALRRAGTSSFQLSAAPDFIAQTAVARVRSKRRLRRDGCALIAALIPEFPADGANPQSWRASSLRPVPSPWRWGSGFEFDDETLEAEYREEEEARTKSHRYWPLAMLAIFTGSLAGWPYASDKRFREGFFWAFVVCAIVAWLFLALIVRISGPIGQGRLGLLTAIAFTIIWLSMGVAALDKAVDSPLSAHLPDLVSTSVVVVLLWVPSAFPCFVPATLAAGFRFVLRISFPALHHAHRGAGAFANRTSNLPTTDPLSSPSDILNAATVAVCDACTIAVLLLALRFASRESFGGHANAQLVSDRWNVARVRTQRVLDKFMPRALAAALCAHVPRDRYVLEKQSSAGSNNHRAAPAGPGSTLGTGTDDAGSSTELFPGAGQAAPSSVTAAFFSGLRSSNIDTLFNCRAAVMALAPVRLHRGNGPAAAATGGAPDPYDFRPVPSTDQAAGITPLQQSLSAQLTSQLSDSESTTTVQAAHAALGTASAGFPSSYLIGVAAALTQADGRFHSEGCYWTLIGGALVVVLPVGEPVPANRSPASHPTAGDSAADASNATGDAECEAADYGQELAETDPAAAAVETLRQMRAYVSDDPRLADVRFHSAVAVGEMYGDFAEADFSRFEIGGPAVDQATRELFADLHLQRTHESLKLQRERRAAGAFPISRSVDGGGSTGRRTPSSRRSGGHASRRSQPEDAERSDNAAASALPGRSPAPSHH